jgi:hypothetical protein
MVAARHPHRFNRLGQARWRGVIYGGLRSFPFLRPIVYHGPMGTAPYQGVIRRRSEVAMGWAGAMLPLTVPAALFGVLAVLSPWWLAAPAVALAAVLGYGAAAAMAVRPPRDAPHSIRFRLLTGLLHVLQPFVRAWGRLTGPRLPEREPDRREWTGDRRVWIHRLRHELRSRGLRVREGGPHEGWDLDARAGPFWSARMTVAVLWAWIPAHRLRVRPTGWAAAGLGIPGGVVGLHALTGLSSLGAMALLIGIQGAILRRRAQASLHASKVGEADGS